ncbi:MAG: Fibronectin type domain protein, partial [Patescibacteria group bacterium]|nr:Fibronectin type domain protein [Patescibacteria group bacterium]
AAVENASSSLAVAITTGTNAVNIKTNSAVATASSSISATLPASIWAYSGRTLSSVGTLVADIWSNSTRTLTGASLNSGSLATLSDITTASSSISAVVNSNTNSQSAAAISSINSNTNTAIATASSSLSAILPASIWGYSSRTISSFGTLAADVWNSTTRTLTSLTLSSQSPWTVSTSDFGSITAGSDYLSTVTTIYDGTLTDSLSLPTVTIYDPSRNVVANNVAMTRTATGTYSYSYTTDGNAPAGTWESVFSANVEAGKTLPGNDYWTVVTAPAQVIINSISDDTTPEVAANVTITNEGLTGYEYQYEWCVVSNISDICGGGDDVFHSIAAKYINAGEDFNTTLTANVPSAGNYYFKMIVYFGTDSSGASRSFTATTVNGGGGGSGGGGGGGGGGGSTSSSGNTSTIGVCTGTDFNRDRKVNSVDFSILLSFWKKRAPFKNTCVDVNRDSIVNSVDFSILLSQWGTAGRAI